MQHAADLTRNTGVNPSLFKQCTGFFYTLYTIHRTYGFASQSKGRSIMVKCCLRTGVSRLGLEPTFCWPETLQLESQVIQNIISFSKTWNYITMEYQNISRYSREPFRFPCRIQWVHDLALTNCALKGFMQRKPAFIPLGCVHSGRNNYCKRIHKLKPVYYCCG